MAAKGKASIQWRSGVAGGDEAGRRGRGREQGEQGRASEVWDGVGLWPWPWRVRVRQGTLRTLKGLTRGELLRSRACRHARPHVVNDIARFGPRATSPPLDQLPRKGTNLKHHTKMAEIFCSLSLYTRSPGSHSIFFCSNPPVTPKFGVQPRGSAHVNTKTLLFVRTTRIKQNCFSFLDISGNYFTCSI